MDARTFRRLVFAMTSALSSSSHALAQADAPAPCTSGVPMYWDAPGTTGFVSAEVDATALQRRRIWVDVTARNSTDVALHTSLLLTFDADSDGSMGFGQSDDVFVPAHSTRHLVLTAWVREQVKRVGVRVLAGDSPSPPDMALELRCSPSTHVSGEVGPLHSLLDEGLALYAAHALQVPTDMGRLRRVAYRLATGASGHDDIVWALRATLSVANDRHSYLVPPGDLASFKASLAPTAPVFELRPDGVAVIAVSQAMFGTQSARVAYARTLHAGVARLASSHPTGWIVDLRRFGGGDLWSTLAGLSALLDGPLVGQFVSREGRETWLVGPGRAGTISAREMVSLGIDVDPPVTGPMAVLIGRGTGSSGEAAAIAFEQRRDTRFFGQPTIGIYNSGVVPYALSDGTLFGIAQTLSADRSGHVYQGSIAPDFLVADGDDAIDAATHWIRAHR